jgi:hypothetical protein
MRERRIRSTATPELRAAVEAGEITLYRGSTIALLPANQQRLALAQWAARSRCRTEGQAVAAQVIRQELQRGSKVDLSRVASAIRDVIALATPLPNHTSAKTRPS